jgi:hypothetical protein
MRFRGTITVTGSALRECNVKAQRLPASFVDGLGKAELVSVLAEPTEIAEANSGEIVVLAWSATYEWNLRDY